MPILEGSLAHLDCEVEAEYPGGDHVILVARVTDAASRNGLPLVFSRGGYTTIAEPVVDEEPESARPTPGSRTRCATCSGSEKMRGARRISPPPTSFGSGSQRWLRDQGRPGRTGPGAASAWWPRVVRPADVTDRLGEPATVDASVHWIVEGWPEDVARDRLVRAPSRARARPARGRRRDAGRRSCREMADALVSLASPGHRVGGRAQRRAGALAGRVVMIVGTARSRPTGDVLGPLVGGAGRRRRRRHRPVRDRDRGPARFHESPGPDVRRHRGLPDGVPAGAPGGRAFGSTRSSASTGPPTSSCRSRSRTRGFARPSRPSR